MGYHDTKGFWHEGEPDTVRDRFKVRHRALRVGIPQGERSGFATRRACVELGQPLERGARGKLP